MNRLRSWFLKSVPEEYFNEFRMDILKENISRIQIFSLLFCFVELCFIVVGITDYFSGLWSVETKHKQMFFLHLIVLGLVLCFTFILFSRKKKHNPSPFYILFEVLFISFTLLWSTVFSIMHLFVSYTIVPYIICCLGLCVAFFINTLFSFILFTLSFIILIFGLYYNCSDLDIFKELMTNSSIVVLISFVISRIIYQKKIDFFLYQKKIEKEIIEKELAEHNLQKINANLEHLVKERTQTLISINEQLKNEIFAKKGLELNLLKEKNTLNNIIEFNPYSIAVFDNNGFYLRGNLAGLNMFQIEPPPDYCIFTDPFLPEETHIELKRLKLGETVFLPELQYNLNHVNSNYPDKTFTLKTTIFPIKNTTGDIENFIQMHADVTDKYNVEKELRQSEEKYRLIVENMEEGIYATKNGIFQSVNVAMTKIFGYSSEELTGMPAWNLAIPEIRDKTKNALYTKVQKKDTSPIAVECMKKNGDIFFADISVSGVTESGMVYGIVTDISQRRHTEEILIESEEKYRLIIENITEVIYLLDIKGNIIYISEFFEKITDYNVSDLIGKPLVDFVFIDDLAGLLENYSKTLSGLEDTYEFRLVLKNGTLKYVKTISKLVVKPDGRQQLIGVILDISEQKNIEFNLAMLESAINQSTDGIAVADMDGVLIYVNKAWAKMHAYSKTEMTGQNIKISHSDEQVIKDVNPFNLQVLKNGHHQGEVGHVKKDGSTFVTWMQTTLLKDSKGKPTGLIGIARDISHRKEAEEKLKLSEDKYRQLFDNAPSGILKVNLNGDILDANKTLLQMLGSTSLENTKKLNVLTFPNLIESGISQKLQECIATQKIIISEHSYHSKWGKTIHARIRFKPIQDSDNNVTGVQAIIDDISPQKEHEIKQKETMDARYAESNQHQKVFMENLSNAIRGPLNMILGFSNILKKPDLSEKKYKFIATSVIEKSNILLRNVNNITTVSQLESKTLEFNYSLCSPDKIITDLIKSYSNTQVNKTKAIKIQKKPARNEKLILFTDEQRLTQILSELLDNAFKNTHYGSIELGFSQDEEDFITFFISDTGIGISPDKQKDFFTNLQNITTPLTPQTQSMGLFICKGIVEQSGGKIWMKSEEGRGSTFYFSLPVKK